VVVTQKNISAPYTLQDETLNLYTFETQVSKPNAIKMASRINKEIFDVVGGGACTAVIGTPASGAYTAGFKDLSKAIAVVESSRVGTSKSAMLHPNAVAAIIGGSANSANLFSQKGDKLYEGEIGTYFGTDCFTSPDAGAIQLGSAISLTVGPIADGATSLNVTAGASNGLTIPKGTPFQIQGVNSCDAFGDVLGVRTFVTTQNYTFGGASGTLPVGTIYFSRKADGTKGDWPIPNTFGAPITASSSTAVCPLAAGQLYGKALAFAERAGAFAAITPAPFPGTNDSVVTQFDGELNVRSSFFSNLESGMIRWRFDVLYGVSSLYGNGAAMIYIPIV